MSSNITQSDQKRKSSGSPQQSGPSRKVAASHQRKFRGRRRFRPSLVTLAIVGVVMLALGVLFYRNATTPTSQAGQYAFQVGSPGVGEQAPAVTLVGTNGSTFDLASMHGKSVLLYFQEGLTCQPCWDQLKDIQSHLTQFQKLGIAQIVSITSDPLDALKQKVADENLSIPVLSDPGLVVSQAYAANSYGMMGNSRDGHTFVLVGPDGRITWRADYGGSPNYTMYVPIPSLLADIQAGLQGKS